MQRIYFTKHTSLLIWITTLLTCAFSFCTDEDTEQRIDLSGKVVRIADGDTFTLLTEKKEQVKVRLHGIDCPERGQDYGLVARQKLSNLIFSKQVFIQELDKDRYGRKVAIVYDEQRRSINEEMLRTGLAWHYKEFDDNEAWSGLEKEARIKHIGLWSHPNPIAPWEWRKKKPTLEEPAVK